MIDPWFYDKKNIKFMILMAGPGTAIDELLVKQNYLEINRYA
jgi:hypothetical protein